MTDEWMELAVKEAKGEIGGVALSEPTELFPYWVKASPREMFGFMTIQGALRYLAKHPNAEVKVHGSLPERFINRFKRGVELIGAGKPIEEVLEEIGKVEKPEKPTSLHELQEYIKNRLMELELQSGVKLFRKEELDPKNPEGVVAEIFWEIYSRYPESLYKEVADSLTKREVEHRKSVREELIERAKKIEVPTWEAFVSFIEPIVSKKWVDLFRDEIEEILSERAEKEAERFATMKQRLIELAKEMPSSSWLDFVEEAKRRGISFDWIEHFSRDIAKILSGKEKEEVEEKLDKVLEELGLV